MPPVRLQLLADDRPVTVGTGRDPVGLARALATAGHDVQLLVTTAPGPGAVVSPGPRREGAGTLERVEVAVEPLTGTTDDGLARLLEREHALAGAALRAADPHPPDVVHALDWPVAHAAVTVATALHRPLVAGLALPARHEEGLPPGLREAAVTLQGWLVERATRVIVSTAAMRGEVRRHSGVPRDHVDVVHAGLAVPELRVPAERVAAAHERWAASPGAPLVVCRGRLRPDGGVVDLLCALPRLRRRHPGLRVVLAGAGEDETALRGLVTRMRLGRQVVVATTLTGAERQALVAAADVVVVPGDDDPVAVPVLEAAVAGTPLAVADAGGLRERVRHEVTGLRFPAGDVAALAAAVTRLLRDEVLARRLVRAAETVAVRDHDWAGVAARTSRTHERAALEHRLLRAAPRGPHALQVVVGERAGSPGARG